MRDKQLTPDELDALIVRELSRLPIYAPSRSFADSVMAQVLLPEPRALVALRQARAWAAQPRRALALASGYAALAVITLGVAVPWLFAHAPSIGFAASWLQERAFGAVREGAIGVAGSFMASSLYDFVRSLSLSSGNLALIFGGLSLGYAACIFGLHQLLRAPRGKDVTVPLSR